MADLDERISAWLDGAMSAAESAQFEAELEHNPALAERLAELQGSDDLLRAAFAAPVEQGVDQALLERMGLIGPPASATVVSLAEARAARERQSRERAASAASTPNGTGQRARRNWAVPVGAALAAGLALTVFLDGGPSGSLPDPARGATLAAAMETLPARASLTLSDGGRVSPVLSFAAADGRFCREFTIAGGSQAGGGIACKGPRGWTVEARTATGAAPADDGRIVTAGGPDGAGLDAAYARLGASDPISADAEQRLIARHWEKSAP